MTVPIPPSYQNCTQEGNLPGCIISDVRPHEQCSQGRTGKLKLNLLFYIRIPMYRDVPIYQFVSVLAIDSLVLS